MQLVREINDFKIHPLSDYSYSIQSISYIITVSAMTLSEANNA